MVFVIRPGRYLIEKSRRRIIGVIAKVGTGGSVPKPVQTALDAFAHGLADGHSGKMAKTIVDNERETIRAGMKQMHGSWLVISPSGLRWALGNGEDLKVIKTTLRNSGWNPPAAQLDELLGK